MIEVLRDRAALRGSSLEAELRDVITQAARPSRDELLARLDAIRAMSPERPPGTFPLAEDLVREMRDER